jgi:hypothetical protein
LIKVIEAVFRFGTINLYPNSSFCLAILVKREKKQAGIRLLLGESIKGTDESQFYKKTATDR